MDHLPNIFRVKSTCTFANLLKLYEEAIKKKADKKSKDKLTLIKFDFWFQNELPIDIRSRMPPNITLEELVKIMRWKLLRGKFRPRLVQLVESNSEEIVKELSQKSFELASNNELKEANSLLCKLKGVGPATASAILTAGFPESCGFFADEVALYFMKKPLKYSLNEWCLINDYLISISSSLNSQDSSSNWSPHKVELALWTYEILNNLEPKALESITSEEKLPKAKRRRI